MSYLESAQGVSITRERALKELRTHGIEDPSEFFEEIGDFDRYAAQTVLAWLGY